MSRAHRSLVWLTVAVLLAPAPAFADEFAALVTEVVAAPAGLQRDAILGPGRSFDLGAEGRVVLAYFNSCILETIRGGRFTTGTDRSTVDGGTVSRVSFDCMGATTLSAGPDAESGGAYSRDPFAPAVIASPQPILMAPGLASGGTLQFRIDRLDQKTQPVIVDSAGPVLDLMRIQRALALGGHYKVTAGGKMATFSVAEEPPAAGASTFARIVVLQ